MKNKLRLQVSALLEDTQETRYGHLDKIRKETYREAIMDVLELFKNKEETGK